MPQIYPNSPQFEMFPRIITLLTFISIALQAASVSVVEVSPSGTYKTVSFNNVTWKEDI